MVQSTSVGHQSTDERVRWDAPTWLCQVQFFVRHVYTMAPLQLPSMATLKLRTDSSRFTTSIAPTSRAKCRGCKSVIKEGSIRVSRDVPTNFTGDTGKIIHHYHFAHGMHAATRVRCASNPPTFGVHVSLNALQARKAKAAGKKAIIVWRQRCKNAS